MAPTAAQDKVRKPLAFTTTEHGGNEVICTHSTWNSHIAAEHPEMVGLHGEVQNALVDPAVIYPSTTSGNALVYEATTTAGIEIRAVVTYDDISRYGTGATIGKVNTAYPVDTVIYDKPNIGTPIYTRVAKPSSKPEEGGKP